VFGESALDGDYQAYRRLVKRVLAGGIPHGREFDACRGVLRSEPSDPAAFQALCMLLEGALADPNLGIDDTQTVVPLLKQLASGDVSVEKLL
jgi:hypothetical protein